MKSPPDLDSLAEDWITLWQSELAALATDPELAEAWAASVSLAAAFWRAQTVKGLRPDAGAWAGLWPNWQQPWGGSPTGAGQPAPGPDAAPRPAAAQPAPDGQHDARDGRDAAADSAMAERLAALERRLAEIEGGAGEPGADQPRPRRPRRKP